MIEGFTHFGWPEGLAIPLGVVEVGSTFVYLVPRTSVLGAVLLTGYVGGATAAHARLGEPIITQAALCVLVWLGLYLREPRVRALLPFGAGVRLADGAIRRCSSSRIPDLATLRTNERYKEDW